MGICCAFIRVSRANIDALLAEPRLIRRFLGMDEAPQPPPSLLSRVLFGRKPDPAAPLAILLPEPREDGDETDVDKAWNGIHYLLTGAAKETGHPLGFIVSGGATVGNEDVGYGPARIFLPEEISAIAAAISGIQREDLLDRYAPEEMEKAGVYPERIWQRDGENAFDYVWEYFDVMREFLKEAAGRDQGVMVCFQ